MWWFLEKKIGYIGHRILLRGGGSFYYNKNALKNIWDLNQVFEKVKTEVHDSLSNYQPYWW